MTGNLLKPFRRYVLRKDKYLWADRYGDERKMQEIVRNLDTYACKTITQALAIQKEKNKPLKGLHYMQKWRIYAIVIGVEFSFVPVKAKTIPKQSKYVKRPKPYKDPKAWFED